MLRMSRAWPRPRFVVLVCALAAGLYGMTVGAFYALLTPAAFSPPTNRMPAGDLPLPPELLASEVPPFESCKPLPGEPAPDFTLTDVEGRPFRLSDALARGPVVLEFGSFT